MSSNEKQSPGVSPEEAGEERQEHQSAPATDAETGAVAPPHRTLHPDDDPDNEGEDRFDAG